MTENMTKPHSAAHSILSTGTVVADVTAHWASLKTGALPPRRSEIDAKLLAHALPDVFLAEIVSPRVARFRICGQRIEDVLGMDMRGMPLTALFKGTARQELNEALEQVILGARVTLSLQGETGFGLPEMTATLALLPLTDEAGRITRVMGVLERRGNLGRSPRRFTLAKPVPDTTPAPIDATARPALRVITGGKA
jgi:hypothetical protein